MDEVRTFGTCEVCGNQIDDRSKEYYVDPEGRCFCCVECALAWVAIEKIEV